MSPFSTKVSILVDLGLHFEVILEAWGSLLGTFAALKIELIFDVEKVKPVPGSSGAVGGSLRQVGGRGGVSGGGGGFASEPCKEL